MNTAEILPRLKGVRRSRQGWIAQCPAHEDRGPSLSIREDNGKTLLHCFAGCTIETISSALKIRVSDLFVEPGSFQHMPHIVRQAERQIADLRSHLTPRERVLPVTVVYCEHDSLDAGMARALAMAVEGEIVQALLVDPQ